MEPWEGTPLSKGAYLTRSGHSLSISMVRKVASLLARVHSLPTAWFDAWREQLRTEHPALQHAPDGSLIWKYSCRPDRFDKLTVDGMQRRIQLLPSPICSAAAARVVTCQ